LFQCFLHKIISKSSHCIIRVSWGGARARAAADTGDGGGGIQGEGGRRSGRKTAVGDDVGTPGCARRAASHGREDTAVGDEAALGDDGTASHGGRACSTRWPGMTARLGPGLGARRVVNA